MIIKLTVFCVLLFLFLSSCSASRKDVINEYKPQFEQQANNVSNQFFEASINYTTLLSTIHHFTDQATYLADQQIKTVQDLIDSELASTSDTKVKACLETQKALAAKLSSGNIAEKCLPSSDSFPEVETARDNFKVLAECASGIIDACTKLNPLAYQDDEFSDCVKPKLYGIYYVQKKMQLDFDDLWYGVRSENSECLTQEFDPVVDSVKEITANVKDCKN